MTPAGGAVLGAGAATVAYATWAAGTLLLQAQLGEWQPQVLGDGVLGLWTGQSLAMALWLPACVDHHGALEGAFTGLLLALFPAPVLAVACLMGALTAERAVAGVATVAVAALALVGVGWIARRCVQARSRRGLVVGVLQSGGVLLVLAVLAHRLVGAAP